MRKNILFSYYYFKRQEIHFCLLCIDKRHLETFAARGENFLYNSHISFDFNFFYQITIYIYIYTHFYTYTYVDNEQERLYSAAVCLCLISCSEFKIVSVILNKLLLEYVVM